MGIESISNNLSPLSANALNQSKQSNGTESRERKLVSDTLPMEEKQTIVACGAGTVTKRVYPDGRIERCDNVKDVALYIEKSMR